MTGPTPTQPPWEPPLSYPAPVQQGPPLGLVWDGFAWVPATKPGRGQAIAALTLGILAVLFGFIPLTFFLAWILGVLALIFGLIGRRHAMGIVGIVLGVAAIGLGFWGLNLLIDGADFLNDCLSGASDC
jgi:hypothetical protein